MKLTNHWDTRYLSLCNAIAQFSKDPSSKVGAVIARPDNTVASIGYNGFPRGIEDTEARLKERDQKYKFVIHAEMNAILNAREPIHGYTLYCNMCPCDRCAMHVIQAGIKRVVIPPPTPEYAVRWGPALDVAIQAFEEAGVELVWSLR
jgi:dCMP deaminase